MIELPYIFKSLLPIKADIDKLEVYPPDKNNKIGVVFDNFLRDNTMYNLVESIFKYSPGVKIYIVEQGVFDYKTNELYNKLIKNGHEIIYIPFNSGISRSRNAGMQTCKEPYMFVMDCDEMFTEHTNLNALVDILENDKKLALVGMTEICEGKEWLYEYNLEYKEPKHLIYVPLKETGELTYCDYTHNLFMTRKELFNNGVIRYQDDMELAEHLDFFMRIKYKSDYKVATTKKYSIINQATKVQDSKYDIYRRRGSNHYWNLYRKYWGLEKINDWTLPPIDTDNTCHYYLMKDNGTAVTEPIINKPKVIEVSESKEIKETPKVEIINSEVKENVVNFYRELFQNSNVWLIEKSCLELIKGKFGTSEEVYIGYSNPLLKGEIERLAAKYKVIIKKLSNEFKKNTKVIEFDGIKILVPFPVVAYLNKLYGNNWSK